MSHIEEIATVSAVAYDALLLSPGSFASRIMDGPHKNWFNIYDRANGDRWLAHWTESGRGRLLAFEIAQWGHKS